MFNKVKHFRHLQEAVTVKCCSLFLLPQVSQSGIKIKKIQVHAINSLKNI